MHPSGVRTGLDRIATEGWRYTGGGVALLCHPASITREYEHAAAVLRRIKIPLASLLGPEHGVDAAAQDMEHTARNVPGMTPTYNLYGDAVSSLSPTPEMFHGADTLVCDLFDVGARYYTYAWTVVLAAEVALGLGMHVRVLDRPNPLGGLEHWVEGGSVAAGFESFVGLHPVAVRHGLTIGELVHLALAERGRVSLERFEVVECVGWRRSMLFPATAMPWVLPSPNMPTFDTALVYPGQCLLEGTNLSEGRGTTRPFELMGAPWIDGEALARAVASDDRPGAFLRPVRFKPTFHKHAHAHCGGVQWHVTDAAALRSLRTSWALLRAAWAQSHGAMRWRTEAYEFVDDKPAIDILAGGSWLREAIEADVSAGELERHCAVAREQFLERRRPFCRYPD